MPRIIKFRNIYFGRDSLVKLFANKTHLQTHVDYDGTTLAFLLDVSDFTNKNALLSHYAIIDKNMLIPILIEWNLKTINGRIMVLKSLNGPRDTKALIFRFGQLVENNPRPEIIKMAAYQYAISLTNAKGLHPIYNFLIQRISSLKSIGIKKSLKEVKRLEIVYR